MIPFCIIGVIVSLFISPLEATRTAVSMPQSPNANRFTDYTNASTGSSTYHSLETFSSSVTTTSTNDDIGAYIVAGLGGSTQHTQPASAESNTSSIASASDSSYMTSTSSLSINGTSQAVSASSLASQTNSNISLLGVNDTASSGMPTLGALANTTHLSPTTEASNSSTHAATSSVGAATSAHLTNATLPSFNGSAPKLLFQNATAGDVFNITQNGTLGLIGNETALAGICLNLKSTGSGSIYASCCQKQWDAYSSASLGFYPHGNYVPTSVTVPVSLSTSTRVDVVYSEPLNTICGRPYAADGKRTSVGLTTITRIVTRLVRDMTITKPSCSIQPADCTVLSKSYQSAYPSALAANFSAGEPYEPHCTVVSQDCNRCTIYGGAVTLIYFPVPSNVSRDMCASEPTEPARVPASTSAACMLSRPLMHPTLTFSRRQHYQSRTRCSQRRLGGQHFLGR